MPPTPDIPPDTGTQTSRRASAEPARSAPPGLPTVPFDLARVPEVPLDGLLRRAAAAAPDRVAVRTPSGTTTYAELDDRADDCAQALSRAAGGSGTVVGLVASLDPSFAVVYYGAVRAGHVVVLVNPHLRGDALTHVLSVAGTTVVVAPPEVAERVAQVRGKLPHLRHVLSPDAIVQGTAGPGGRVRDAPGPAPHLDSVACVQFTSGTTGEPKAVQLTHRNLVVNAAQIAAVHGLDGDAVALNNLPLYHPMHLNAAVYAGATQVLSPSADPAEAIEAANRHRATHYYSLPVRLAHLAADPRLPGLRLETVRAVFSGGSALLPAQARTLGAHFGIPVVQGYGLAETSPLTHGEPPARPRPGSVGPVVPGTDCRVVDMDRRTPLPAGRDGEIQVRGPQLMRGYLGAVGPAVGADGWFSTGDIGHQDQDGYLYLVDRIKDVFKCENWLVSPTEIEQVLITHPAVRDCAVVDHPEPFSGAVAHAFVVLDEDAGPSDPAELTAHVNHQVPYYQQIKFLEVVERVPRSPNGKILRRELRARAAHTDRADRAHPGAADRPHSDLIGENP
ncbi:class I adenylate-forming enzyme family protein [Streptomyces sp. NPDC060030]|uniref:class I adenylate-forming enzyme family protein n=1 Tax=Streptomyces sp. NPDC060030 TaxID=3347042 RepID=UPI0036B2FAAE